MTISTKDERRRVTRYAIVRATSRGGDLAIYSILLSLYGLPVLPYAFAVSALFNYTVDFFGQKFWAFSNPIMWSRRLLREFAFYMVVRGGVIVCAAGTLYLLTTFFRVELWIATVIVVVIFLPIAFLLYRRIFFGRLSNPWTPPKM